MKTHYAKSSEKIQYTLFSILKSAKVALGIFCIVFLILCIGGYFFAKTHVVDIHQPIRIQYFWIFVSTFLLILICGLIIFLLWKQQLLRAERERLVLLQHLDYLVKYANDIIILCDYEGNIYEVNDKAVTTYGYSREELLNMNILKLRPEGNTSELEQKFNEVIKTGGKIFESNHLRKNGETFPVEVSSRVMEVKEEIFVQGIIRDITERKQTEEAIRQMNSELEKRVNKRTAQLENVNKELESFAYSVAHDLRAPLRNIDGWSQVLLEEKYAQLDEKGRQYLGRVRSETQRMGYLIDDLLKLARVSRSEVKKERVNLSALAQKIATSLKEGASDRKFEFKIQLDLTTECDPKMAEIALINLMDNASKFTSKQPTAKIEFGQSIINETHTFWLKDNGVGFDMANSKLLFNPFQRLHKQSEFPGTGVGLATVQRIIQNHDGKIWVDSRLNQGTTFFFTL